VVAVLVRLLPKTRFYSAMVLSEVVPMGPGVEVGPAWRAVIGSTGVALTTLRPSGKASLGGHTADVVSQGEFLDAGTRLRVVRIEGPHVVVEREG
jgi:membrane-bound serine protease (ClpP class)